MSEQLAKYQVQQMDLSDTMELGKAMAESGFFADSRDAAKAVVKILAGRELGFGPVASMTGINVIKGKVSLSANLIAASVKRSGRYNYRVVQMSDDACSIDFYEGSQKIGNSTFTATDAKKAQLGGQNWQKFPRNMLFARAMSNGAKWYCPDLSGGPLYTPDELGMEVNGETGEIVEGELEPAPQQKPEPKALTRPFSPEALQKRLTGDDYSSGAAPADNRFKYALSSLNAVTNGDNGEQKAIVKYLFGVISRKDLTAGNCEALIKWIGANAENEWQPHPDSVKEAQAIVRAERIEAGQGEIAFEDLQYGGAAYAE